MSEVPHDVAVEDSLLGAMLLSPNAISSVAPLIHSGDFYQPSGGLIFDAIIGLWRNGQAVDPVTVAAALDVAGVLETAGGRGRLMELQASTPSTTSAGRYARIIADHAARRRIIALALETAERCRNLEDPGLTLQSVRAGIAELDVPLDELPDGIWSVDDFMARPEEDQEPWVIPGLFRVGWRAIIVATEGAGKTSLAHTLALCAAQGLHPFALTDIPPVKTLLVDLENPDERILDGFKMVNPALQNRRRPYQADQAWLWHQPGGINIRQRADRGRLEAVVAATQPKLVCLGPLYKLYSLKAHETDEIAAREVMEVLDDLRTRYGFAMFLEHHAPKEQGGHRKMTPYGSSFWLRWPEFGFSLSRDAKRNKEGEHVHYLLERFRHDRVKHSWPIRLSKSTRSALPWEAAWDDGSWREPSKGEEEPF